MIGFGLIGQYLYKRAEADNNIEVKIIIDPHTQKPPWLPQNLFCKNLSELSEYDLDLVVEAANASAAIDMLPHIPQKASLFIVSSSSLANHNFYDALRERGEVNNSPIYIPHGAILGTDGIVAGRSLIESICITTRKAPKNLNLSENEIKDAVVVFNGSTREACLKFPANVNSHATIALAGLGFDKTQSIIIADPSVTTMSHEIEISGRGIHWHFKVESKAKGLVTGAYTPESIYQSLKMISGVEKGLSIV